MKTSKKVSILFVIIALISAFFIFTNVMADIANGLGAYWPLNNNGQDVSGNYNIATLYGPTGAENRNGYANFALNFDGVNDYADVADNNTVDIEASDFSISVWIKPTIAGYNLLDKRDQSNNDNGYLLYTDSLTGILSFRICGDYRYNGVTYNGKISYPSGITVPQGVYNHVVITVDRDSTTGMKFYLNNTLVSTQDPTRNILSINSNANLKIGRHSYLSNYFFKGGLDDVRIYKRAISATEINELFNETNPDPIEYAGEVAVDYNNDGADEVAKLGKTSDGVIVTMVYLDNTTPTTITGFFNSSLSMTPKTITKATLNNNTVIVITAENMDNHNSLTQVFTIGSATPFGTPINLPLYQ